MMKITVGLGSEAEYERFVRAGADEFFCGYVPYSWSRKYGTVMPLNRREVLCYNVQIGAFSELEILAAMVKKYKKPVHLTLSGDCSNHKRMYGHWFFQLYYCRPCTFGVSAGAGCGL